jgi:hypothetical protein
MTYRQWFAGGLVALVAAAGTVVFTDVSFRLAGLLGLIWGVVAWARLAYPNEFSVDLGGLEGGDRWLAGMSLLLVACAFATVRVLSIEGRVAAVLYWVSTDKPHPQQASGGSSARAQ